MADAAYLQESVGPALTAGLASCASAQPEDPVDYLAHWLLKYLAVQEKKDKAAEAEAAVKKEKEALDAAEQTKVDAEAAKVHKLNEAKAAVEKCTNIPMFYEAVVKGVRENTKAANVYVALLKAVTPEEDVDAEGNPTAHDDEETEVWEEDTREPPAAGEDGEVPELPPWVPPKILPMIPKYSKLQYVFASEGNTWLKGKELRSPACKANKDPSMGGGGGRDTVSFQAVTSRGGTVIRNVLESDPELHFFDMPMPGSFACQTLLTTESDKYLAGGVMGVLCCDTVNAEGTMEDKDGETFKDLAATASATYERLLEEQRLRMIAEDELATKLLEVDIVWVDVEPAEGEEPKVNPEACLAPEEGDDAEKDVAALDAEIATLSANLDLTDTGSGRIAVVKAVLKESLPAARTSEHGHEVAELVFEDGSEFAEGTPGHRVVKAVGKIISADTTDLKESAADFAAALAAFDIKTLTQEVVDAVGEDLGGDAPVTKETYPTLPFAARLLYALVVVVQELAEPALRLANKKKIKADKEAAAAEAEAAAAVEAAAAAGDGGAAAEGEAAPAES